MSYGDDRPRDDSERDERFEPEVPRKRGMSGGTKVLMILLVVFGILLLACCGGVVYLYQQMKAGLSTDPAVVDRVTSDITDIDLPEKFKPLQSMEMKIPFGPKMQMVFYRAGKAPSVMMMIAVNVPMDEFNEEKQAEIRGNMKPQGEGAPELTDVESLKPFDVTIRGEEIRFDFIKGTDSKSGEKMIQVKGVFPGKSGAVMLLLVVTESEFKRAELETLLKSIK